MLARKASLLTRRARLIKDFDDLCKKIDAGEINTKQAVSRVEDFIVDNDKALKKYTSVHDLATKKQNKLLKKEFTLLQAEMDTSDSSSIKKSINQMRKFIRRRKKELSRYPHLQEEVRKNYTELVCKDLDEAFEPVKKTINETVEEDINLAISHIESFISANKKALATYPSFRDVLAENHQELLDKKFSGILREIELMPIEDALANVEDFIDEHKKPLGKYPLLREIVEEKRQALLAESFNEIRQVLKVVNQAKALSIVEDFLLSHEEGLASNLSLQKEVHEKYHDLISRELAVLREAIGKVDPWESIANIEKFIVTHKRALTYYPDEAVKSHYLNLISEFSNNLGRISRNIFLGMAEKDLYNTSIKSSPESHFACVNAAENVASKIVAEIIGCHDIDERTLTIWRYLVIAKMRLDVGDYQAAEFIVSALAGPAVSRLKAAFEGLPLEILRLQKSLDRLSLRSDTHIMRHRVQPVIPSLARIKKLMTFADDEHVAKSKRNSIIAMLKTIHDEIKMQEEIENHLQFFNLDTVTHTPWVTLDTFNAVQYTISVAEIERRGEKIPRSDLFAYKTDFLPDVNLKINIDTKINTFLKIYLLKDKAEKLYEPIQDLLDEMTDLKEKKGMKKIEDLFYDQNPRHINRLIDGLQSIIKENNNEGSSNGKENIKNERLEKIINLRQLLLKLRRYRQDCAILEKKYKKLEKKYREHSVAPPKFQVGRKSSFATPIDDLPIYQLSEDSEKEVEEENEQDASSNYDSCQTVSAISDMSSLIVDLDSSSEEIFEKRKSQLNPAIAVLADESIAPSVLPIEEKKAESTTSTDKIVACLHAEIVHPIQAAEPQEVDRNISDTVDRVAAPEIIIEPPVGISRKLLDRVRFFESTLGNSLGEAKAKVKIEISPSEIREVNIGSKIKFFNQNNSNLNARQNVESVVQEVETLTP